MGITGNIYTGGIVNIQNTSISTSTSSGALVVNGGVGIKGNLNIGGNLNVDGSNAYFANSVYINNKNGRGPTVLSMTDFSYNAVFYSTSESTGTGNGSIVVSGGAGIAGNLNVGKSGFFNGGLTVGTDSSFNGNIYINNNSNLFLGNSLYFGPDSTKLSMTDFLSNVIFHSTTDSTSTGSGSVVVSGGAGISGNLFVGNSLYFGPSLTKLSMTDFLSNVIFHSITDSTSTGNGSVVVSGGVGISGNIFLGNSLFFGPNLTRLSMTDFSSNVFFHSLSESTGTGYGSIVVSGGLGLGKSAYIGGNLTVDGNSAYFANSVYINNKNGLGRTVLSMTDFSSNVIFHSTTDSTGTGYGSVVISGGAGISGNIFLGNSLFFGPNLTRLSMTDFSSNVIFHSIVESTGTGYGSVVVSGGLGLGKSAYIGGNLTVDGSSAYFANSVYINNKNGRGPTVLSMTDFSYNAVFYSTSESTGTGYGSIVVSGGVGINKSAYIGGNLTVDGSSAYFANSVYINNKNGIGRTVLSMTDFSSNVVFHSTTESTSTGNGSVVVFGGIGIGGNINIQNKAFVNSTYDSYSTNTGSLVVSGGVGINGNVYANGYNGGSLSYNNVVKLGRTVCYYLNSINSIDVSNGVNIFGNQPGTAVGGSLYLNGTSGLYSGGSIYCADTTNATSTTSGALQVVGGAAIGGNLYIGKQAYAVAFNQSSDYRIKSNIQVLDSDYTVDNLTPIRYHNVLSNRDEIGFLADQVQKVYPYLVTGEKDGDDYQSMNYIGLIGILVNEIKDLKRRISLLES